MGIRKMNSEILFRYENWGTHVFPSHINMALEEFLIKRIADEKLEKHLAAVRFYSFVNDSIVLGYAQDTDIIRKLERGVELTRRITGGSHVQTGPNTLAYTFVVPRDGNLKTIDEMRAYFAAKVAHALSKIGIYPIDVNNKASIITVNGRIIASHAMWWGLKSALLHGIIILSPYDVDKIVSRVVLQQRQIGNQIYSEYLALKHLPVVSEELTKRKVRLLLKPHFLRNIVADAILKEVTGNRYIKRTIDNRVIRTSLELFKKRYGEPLWIKEHKPEFTEEEVEEIPGEELAGPLKKNLCYCLFIQVPDEDFKIMSDPIK